VNAVMLLEIFLFPKATIYLDFFIPLPAFLLVCSSQPFIMLSQNCEVGGADTDISVSCVMISC